MNITKNVILDLYPLYLEKECSPDSQKLVEEYLRQNPREAEEFKRAQSILIPRSTVPAGALDELQALKTTRKRVRGRATIMGLAIFFSLAPFSVNNHGGTIHWMFLDAPIAASLYGAIAVVLWFIYATLRRKSKAI